jgi:hypothetical protein
VHNVIKYYIYILIFSCFCLIVFITVSKCAWCAQCAHCTLCAPGAQNVPQVHECAHLIVVTSKQLRVAHCVHTCAPCAQGYTKTFLMSTLRRRQPDWWRQVAYTGTKLLYQPQPQPVVYIVPIQNILGRLALAPYGEHGTIPHEWHHLQGSHYPRGVCDSPNRPGSGSKLFYINSWAMIWSSDHPRVATKAK